ncbi:hemin uptake protein HemP [Nitrosococcus halophilus]|uniref:hemin uptake protein HemP n=1 Tax=Nitrosococcus halophilus TaxID=133539 RepID=UPI0006750640|nr:hemin uptake protein HemP [Nitrosococcus halophilus]
MNTSLPEKKGASVSPSPGDKARLRLHSTTLFTHNREVIIEHEGEEYRLRITSKGKLILTK